MKKLILLIIYSITCLQLSAQTHQLPRTKVMTLGVFHFAYPNLDMVKVDKENQISVLDEPYQSEIISIAKSITKFNPTIIAIERTPDNQNLIDSLFTLYKQDKLKARKDEIHQLGFRIGKDAKVKKIVCVDDPGRHYNNLLQIFNDSTRLSHFEDYVINSRDPLLNSQSEQKVKSIIDALIKHNNREMINEDLSTYLYNTFKYEERPGDFTGVDFETGRWFNRNLRIFRNIQRIEVNKDDRILLIIGKAHLNLLNWFIDVSREYELVSPLPYLESAKSL